LEFDLSAGRPVSRHTANVDILGLLLGFCPSWFIKESKSAKIVSRAVLLPIMLLGAKKRKNRQSDTLNLPKINFASLGQLGPSGSAWLMHALIEPLVRYLD
jgi:hypothetical protein